MDNVTFIETTDAITDEITEHAIIDRGNGEYTSMHKSTYDAQQVAKATLVSDSSTLASELSNPSTPQAGE